MQAITDLLKMMQMEVSVYHNAKVCGDWQIKEHEIGQTCFHMATESGYILDMPDRENYALSCGDLVIFPHELPHTMKPLEPLFGPQQHVAYDSELVGVGMLCGKVHFKHQASQQLLSALPHILIVKNDETTPWLSNLLHLIQHESYQSDTHSSVILDKLSELLFTYALRHYTLKHHSEMGVLALYADKKLNKAITAIHNEPAKQWTLERLASIAMQSRTSFAENFKAVSGWTPMHYLTWWRMQLAWSSLKGGTNVSLTADLVGYKSEAAFSRTFKQHFNLTPGQVKKQTTTTHSV
jgi:AraC-like DNA-binding protein